MEMAFMISSAVHRHPSVQYREGEDVFRVLSQEQQETLSHECGSSEQK